jgi:hypothetical protein
LFWFFGLTFGLLEAVTSRFSILFSTRPANTPNIDGIFYLDLARAFLNHDWNSVVNAYWSPLYGCLLGAGLWLARASPYWESTVAHAVNLVIFAASMAAFEFFLRELCRHRMVSSVGEGMQPLPKWAMQVFGYSLCIYAGLVWISVAAVTPDQCVALVMYLAGGLLLRMQREQAGWASYALLGVLLGVGYLIKAALFPLGLVALAATPFLATRASVGKRLGRALVTALTFAIVASPLVIALSHAKGRFTFGDTGKIAYAEMVDGLPGNVLWQGEGNLGTPKHPVRKIATNPSVFEFAMPVGGTYPPWNDPSYWLDGLKTRLDIGGQLHLLVGSVHAYSGFILEQGGLVVAFIALFVLDAKRYSFWRETLAAWPGWFAAIAGIGMFALVLVESRYVASFLVIAGLSAMAGIRLLPSVGTRRFVIGLAAAVAALNLFVVASLAARNLPSSLLRPRNAHWEVAQALTRRGIGPGDTVATIIDHRLGDYWAHLAGTRIVEEIPIEEMPKVASLRPEERAALIPTLQQPGAKAIVTTPAPPDGTGFRWEQLGNTEYFMAPLTEGKAR